MGVLDHSFNTLINNPFFQTYILNLKKHEKKTQTLVYISFA
jgi:hypothetical protein